MSTEEHENNKIPTDEGLAEASRLTGSQSLGDLRQQSKPLPDKKVKEMMKKVLESPIESIAKLDPLNGRITDLPPLALLEIAKFQPVKTMLATSSMIHLDHALNHAMKALIERNDQESDEHACDRIRTELSHFAARALITLEMFIKETEK